MDTRYNFFLITLNYNVMKEIFIKIKEIIDRSEKILLASHTEPDGDALGSMLGLKIALAGQNKNTDIFCASEIPANLKFLPGTREIKRNIGLDYDLVLGLDYGDLRRLETVVAGLNVALPMISFDHHPLMNQSGQIKIIDINFSSTSEIIYQFLSANGIEIDRRAATCLLTGIFTDTWSFRHPNATAETLKTVGSLVLKGAPLQRIAKFTNQINIEAKSKIWGKALANIRSDKETNFIYCFLNYQDMFESRAVTNDLSGLASLLCMVPGISFSLVLSEFAPGQIDGSMRALPDKGIDVSILAKNFGGGGHKLSAGFKAKGQPEKIIERVKDLISHSKSDNL